MSQRDWYGKSTTNVSNETIQKGDSFIIFTQETPIGISLHVLHVNLDVLKLSLHLSNSTPEDLNVGNDPEY